MWFDRRGVVTPQAFEKKGKVNRADFKGLCNHFLPCLKMPGIWFSCDVVAGYYTVQ